MNATLPLVVVGTESEAAATADSKSSPACNRLRVGEGIAPAPTDCSVTSLLVW